MPAILTRDPERSLAPGDLLYRLYVTVLLGGMYGGAVIHAIVTVPTPAPTPTELLQLGLLLAVIPGVAVLLGVHLGRWVGLVAVSPAEAQVLLPTPVSRRALLRGRAWRATALVSALLAVLGVVGVALLALQREVHPGAWGLLPVAGLGAAAVLAATALVVQGPTERSARVPVPTLAGIGLVSVPLAAATTLGGRQGLERVARAWLVAPTGTAIALLLLAAGLAVAATAAAIGHLDELHDEPLRSRAGGQAGVAASLKLGDLRALRLSRDPSSRARPIRTRRPPGPVTSVVRWRHLVAHRSRPAGLVRVVVGWALATALLVALDPPTTVASVVFRVLVAAGLAAAATVPVVEPMRRDHDAPLAAELLPLSYAALQRAHVRAALVLGLTVIVPTTSMTAWMLAPELTWWVGPAAGLLAGTCAVLAAADRVRQPGSLAESMATLPMGATPELLGVALAGVLLLPVIGMVPAALPLGFALAGPLLDVPALPLALGGAVLGVVLLAFRVVGLMIWLQAAETALADASAPEPGSSLPLAWHRLRDRRRG